MTASQLIKKLSHHIEMMIDTVNQEKEYKTLRKEVNEYLRKNFK